MSLEEKAEQATEIANQISDVARMIVSICDLARVKYELNGETIEFSQEKKQKIIAHYQTLKTKLEGLVEALP